MLSLTPRRENYEDYRVDIDQTREDGELMFMKALISQEDEKLNEDEKCDLILRINKKIARIE